MTMKSEIAALSERVSKLETGETLNPSSSATEDAMWKAIKELADHLKICQNAILDLNYILSKDSKVEAPLPKGSMVCKVSASSLPDDPDESTP